MATNREYRDTEIPYLERTKKTLINAHHCSGVVELSAVVRRAEQRNQLSLREELVTVFDDLVCAAYEVHVVLLKEARHDVGAECEGHTTIVLAPTGDILVRIRPEKVAKKTAVGDL